jgi:dihydrofolate synthase/folylpolyglutamate synthase
MRYSDAIHFIYNLELFGIKMGLGNITRMLAHIGNPESSFKSIHVAGTNGKGSVATLLFSILKAAGYRTGVFTSPHLVDFRERFQTNEGHIDKRSLARFIGENQKFIRDARITFFEISTALAFWYFQRRKVEIAIAEVGLGGRLDATNILKPEVSVITDIDYDHTKILGNSLEKIAIEKAGVIKNSAPVVTGVRRPHIYRLLREICRERDTVISRPPLPRQSFSYSRGGMRFTLSPNGDRAKLYSPLVGVHQIRNAAVAVKTIKVLNRKGIHVPAKAVTEGLRNWRWPGRFQVVCKSPLILLDVAHNPAGSAALYQSFRIAYPGRKVIMVCGFLERPDYDLMLQTLAPITKRAIITKPDYRRAAEFSGVIWAAVNAGIVFDARPRVADAVDRALKLARRDDAVLICGSHFTVGEAIVRLEELHRRGQLSGLSADITNING